MADLKKQIYYLERSIVEKKRRLNGDYVEFTQALKQPASLYTALLGSFAVGFLMSRKSNSRSLLQKTLTIPYFMNKVYRNFKMFARFIPM